MSSIDIFNAIIEGKLDDVKSYIDEKGVDVNAKDENGGTLLHSAVRNGQSAEIVKFLVTEGKSDVNAKDNDDSTPLHSAIMKNNVDFAKILISAGANVNAKNNKGLTPLGFALHTENIELINILLNAGANINAKDQPNGGTPLHYVVLKKNIELAKLLVSKGADVKAKDDEGLTPLDFAKENRDKAMMQYLSSSTKTKNPLITMLIGAVIGGIIGCLISIKLDGEILPAVPICIFFGIGLGNFLKCVIEEISKSSALHNKLIDKRRAETGKGADGSDLFSFAIGVFFIVVLALIISPFTAIMDGIEAIVKKRK